METEREGVKEKATQLRKQGLTYPKISEALGGVVSVDWCKRNLKGVIPQQVQTPNDACLEELIALATRPQGCTDYEAKGVVFKHYENVNNEKVRYLKKRAKTLNKNCIYRPDWIDPTQPSLSHKSINAFALHLQDTIDNLVEEYMEIFPNTSQWAVKYEMLKLSCSAQISKEPLSKRIYRNELIAEEMQERWDKEEGAPTPL